jgi:hypothetical protein
MSLINKYNSKISHSENDLLWNQEQLFIYGLFNDAVSHSDYTASNPETEYYFSISSP